MSNLSRPSGNASARGQTSDRLIDRVISQITPFFSLDAPADEPVARGAAWELVTSYGAVTGRELQFAAQIAAFSMASLDCLRCSMEVPNLPPQIVLRIQNNAITLNAMSDKSSRTLQVMQRSRLQGHVPAAEATWLNEAEFNAAIAKARTMVTFARTKLEAHRVANALEKQSAAKPKPPRPVIAPVITPVITPVVPRPVAARIAGPVRNPDVGPERAWAGDLLELYRQIGKTMH